MKTEADPTDLEERESLRARVADSEKVDRAARALIAGDVDAVMIDNVSGLGYVGANPDSVKLIEQSIKSEELGFMFGKGSPLKAPIDATLEAMQADGKMEELYTKWFETKE